MLRTLMALLVMVPMVARAQLAPRGVPARAASSGDSAAIAALERRVEAAVLHRDAAVLDSIYAPTFRFKHSTGALETRAQLLSALRKPLAPGTSRMISRDLDSLDVEVHADVALTTGRIHVVRDGGGPPWQNYTVRYARVYVRADARSPWRLLTHHSTNETQGAPPPFGAAHP